MSNPETRFSIERANAEIRARTAAVRRTPYALRYHIAPPCGWMNDPNGLCRSGGRYHVFYQHYPYAPQWGPMHWGHASSADLAHWRHEPVALAPDQPYEAGCFSGSGADDSGVLTLVYTAHDDARAIKETQCVARSFDGGRTFVKSANNPVIPAPPEGCETDFRDPKIWREGDRWLLVVGTARGGRGCAALYESADVEHWQFKGILCESDGGLGSMWECPSFCRVDGQDLLLISPIGMEGHKNIALFGAFDPETGRMAVDHWQEIDLGGDFYAAQVLDDGGRTLMFGWMDMWNREHPTEADGWAGALTIPRELSVREGRLLQNPPRELEALRGETLADSADPAALRDVQSDCYELRVELDAPEGALVFSDARGELLRVELRDGEAMFAMPDRPAVRAPLALPFDGAEIRAFIDRCSIECFVNGGEACYTCRVYPQDHIVACAASGPVRRVRAWALGDAFEEAPC